MTETGMTETQWPADSCTISVRLLDPDLPLPAYAHPGDAGADLVAAAGVDLAPGDRALVPTGVAIALPDGYAVTRPELGVLWFDPSAFVNPSPYTYGNTPRTISTVRLPGAFLLDASLFKTLRLTERVKLQFRAESFNLPNWVNLGSPNTSFTALSGSNQNGNVSLGRITSSRSGRNLQFALKLMF